MDVGRQKLRKNCDFEVSRETLSHEMDVGRQKLRKNCDFEVSRATLSHEMDVGRQKLRKNCDFEVSRATLSHEMDVGRQKLRKNCDFEVSIATLSHEMDVGRQKLRKIATMFAHLCLQLRSSTASWYRALHVSQRADALHWIVHWSSALLRFFSISIATMFVHLVVPRFVSVCWRLMLQKQYLEFCVGGGALMILMFFFVICCCG